MASDGGQIGTKIEEAIALLFDPGLGQWEGLKRNATRADLEKIKKILTKLSLMEIVSGYLEVQNTNVRHMKAMLHKLKSEEKNETTNH